MQALIDDDTRFKLITAPPVVRNAYTKTVDWLGWWMAFGNPWPSQEAIDASFWRTLAKLGGTDADFEWMLAAGLCDENDRALFASTRATV